MMNIILPIDDATDSALDRIAAATQRDKTSIAAFALSSFAQEEADVIDAILRGRADAAAGRTVSHEEAMSRLRQTTRGS